jgi:hypothetical protein
VALESVLIGRSIGPISSKPESIGRSGSATTRRLSQAKILEQPSCFTPSMGNGPTPRPFPPAAASRGSSDAQLSDLTDATPRFGSIDGSEGWGPVLSRWPFARHQQRRSAPSAASSALTCGRTGKSVRKRRRAGRERTGPTSAIKG